jgi:hypothetical protein
MVIVLKSCLASLRANELIQKMLKQEEEKEKLPLEETKATYEKMEVYEFITEEEACKVDEESLLKEIETEGPEKIAKIPIGMKIDEIDEIA